MIGQMIVIHKQVSIPCTTTQIPCGVVAYVYGAADWELTAPDKPSNLKERVCPTILMWWHGLWRMILQAWTPLRRCADAIPTKPTKKILRGNRHHCCDLYRLWKRMRYQVWGVHAYRYSFGLNPLCCDALWCLVILVLATRIAGTHKTNNIIIVPMSNPSNPICL